MDSFKQFVEYVNTSVDQDIISLYGNNEQIRRISELTGVSIAGIYRILERYGIKPHRRNYDNEHSVVKQYHSVGIPVHKISELTGYSKRQVYNILATINN